MKIFQWSQNTFSIVSTNYSLFNLVQIIQRSKKHPRYLKSYANHSSFWKLWNNRAKFINTKVQYKIDILDTTETCQNCPLYNSTGNLWTQTPYFDAYIYIYIGKEKANNLIAMVKILEWHQWKSSLFSKALFVDLQQLFLCTIHYIKVFIRQNFGGASRSKVNSKNHYHETFLAYF